ncbi:MAG: phosphatidylglycerophosphatase A [Phycisphaerales bacterium]|nr:phosphatidylglycerophosphatase A [Phycisphaerales bacterium]
MTRLLLSTAGGLGLLRPAPGTWGSLPPVALTMAMASSGPTPTLLMLAALTVFAGILCVMLAPWYAVHFGQTDPGAVVIDEVSGMSLCLLIALAIAPEACAWPNVIWTTVIAFVLFRLLDIAKPPPIGTLQQVPRGWGVLLDDLAAGFFAGLGAGLFTSWWF